MSVRMILKALDPGAIVTLSDIDENDVALSPANATITVTFESDGNITKTEGGVGPTDIGDWLSPKSGMSNYSIKATLTSGTPDVGSDVTGSFLALSSDRSWSITRTNNTAGADVVVLAISIALTANTANVLGTCTLTLTANVIGP